MSVEIRTIATALETATVEKLREVALGRSTELPRMRVIATLPQLDAAAARPHLLKIIDDNSVAPHLREVAIGALSRYRRDAIEDLKRFARDRHAGVAQAAIKALGRVGDASALATLDEVARTQQGPVKERAVFAAGLIAHRLQLPGHDLPSVKLAKYLGAPELPIAVKARPATGAEQEVVKSTLGRHPIELPARTASWELECGKRRWALVIDESALSPWSPQSFAGTKRYLGQLAPRNPTTGTYSPGLAFLATSLGGGRFEVGMYRSNGRLIYGGEGHVDGQAVRFTMHAVDRPGASSTVIEGSYGAGGLDLKLSTSARRARPALRPRPLDRQKDLPPR